MYYFVWAYHPNDDSESNQHGSQGFAKMIVIPSGDNKRCKFINKWCLSCMFSVHDLSPKKLLYWFQ